MKGVLHHNIPGYSPTKVIRKLHF